ncbi:MAG: diacylglycerol kinase [Spirochaetaceae bacterium]|jgi:diacylglycerol kinase family enzyme|nr:diacylglycerol kinase [Spirochaetaceae bacterium]
MGFIRNSVPNLERFKFFASSLKKIIERTPASPGWELVWLVIINREAGGFTIKKRWKSHENQMPFLVKEAEKNPLREKKTVPAQLNGPLADYGAVFTEDGRRAGEITHEFIKEARENGVFYLIIVAGGDGASRDVLLEVNKAPDFFRNQSAILRLPMGTGNDGADGVSLTESLLRIIKKTNLAFNPALSLKTPEGRDFFAFNILSFGLDAFVTHMTNKMKSLLPYDSYKLWVDMAALFYDKIYKVGYTVLDAYNEAGAAVYHTKEKILFAAMGAGGGRSYGSGVRILPDERNVCVLKQAPLLRKIELKSLCKTGKHINEKEAVLFNACELRFFCDNPVLAQMDGETVLLRPSSSPAVIKLFPGRIPVFSSPL